MTLMRVLAAIQAAFEWSKQRPHSLGYGVFLVMLAQIRAGDVIMFAAGIAVIAGGIIGTWRYFKT
jgi:hypothetical protein